MGNKHLLYLAGTVPATPFIILYEISGKNEKASKLFCKPNLFHTALLPLVDSLSINVLTLTSCR